MTGRGGPFLEKKSCCYVFCKEKSSVPVIHNGHHYCTEEHAALQKDFHFHEIGLHHQSDQPGMSEHYSQHVKKNYEPVQIAAKSPVKNKKGPKPKTQDELELVHSEATWFREFKHMRLFKHEFEKTFPNLVTPGQRIHFPTVFEFLLTKGDLGEIIRRGYNINSRITNGESTLYLEKKFTHVGVEDLHGDRGQWNAEAHYACMEQFENQLTDMCTSYDQYTLALIKGIVKEYNLSRKWHESENRIQPDDGQSGKSLALLLQDCAKEMSQKMSREVAVYFLVEEAIIEEWYRGSERVEKIHRSREGLLILMDRIDSETTFITAKVKEFLKERDQCMEELVRRQALPKQQHPKHKSLSVVKLMSQKSAESFIRMRLTSRYKTQNDAPSFAETFDEEIYKESKNKEDTYWDLILQEKKEDRIRLMWQALHPKHKDEIEEILAQRRSSQISNK